MSYNGSSFNKQHNYVDDEIHQENPYGRNRNIRSKYARFNNPCNATEYQPQLRQNNHQHFNPSHNHIHNNPRFNNNQHRTNSNNANNFFNNQYSNNTLNEDKKLDIDAETERNNSFAYITLALGLLLVTIIFIISVVHQKNSSTDTNNNQSVVEEIANSQSEENQQIVDISATDTPLSLGNDTGDIMLDGSQEDMAETEESTVPTHKATAKPTSKPTTKPTSTPKPTTRPTSTSTPTITPTPTIDTSLQTVNETHVAYTLNLTQTSGIIYPKIKGTNNAISEGVLRYYDSSLGRNVDKYWRIQLDDQGNGSTSIMLTSGVTQYQLIILKTTLIGTANATISSSLASYEIR